MALAYTSQSRSMIVPVDTFAPEPYELIRPFHIVIEKQEDEYAAHFFDANISTAGETEQEAIDNLKSLILDFFDSLDRKDPTALGPVPAKQQAVLRSLIRRL